VVYVSDTKDDNILQIVRKAIETTGEEIRILDSLRNKES
jgi:hypothetical protein